MSKPATSSSAELASSNVVSVSSSKASSVSNDYPKTKEEFLASVKPYGTKRGYKVSLLKVSSSGAEIEECIVEFQNDKYLIRISCPLVFLGKGRWTTCQVSAFDFIDKCSISLGGLTRIGEGDGSLGCILNDYRWPM